MQVHLNLDSVADYELFLKIKALPTYRFQGRRHQWNETTATWIAA
jgi:hypothetical protein